MSYIPESMHWRQELNNWLQKHGGVNQLSWEMFFAGPQNNPTWTAIAMINQVEYGRGRGGSKGAAREDAAFHALQTHQAEVVGRNNHF